MITRYFNLFLNAGSASPLVISANQYDHGEQWVFTLYSQLGVKYEPSSGAIVGIKSDNLGIINSGSVDSEGRVVINETTQMTAVAGRAIFELLIDGETHGTHNFYVEVEPKPGDNADFSASDLSLIQEAINSIAIAGSGAPAVVTLASQMTDEGKVYLYAGSETGYTKGDWYYYNGSAWMDGGKYGGTVDSTLTISGAAADAKKTGDEISELKSQISQNSGLTEDVKVALLDCFENIGGLYLNENARMYIANLRSALYPPVNLSYISAVYEQSGDVYATTPLDNLKADLVVTAHYSDGTSENVTSYSLSGTLAEGTSTITVTYGGKTTTFNVIVSEIYVPYNLNFTFEDYPLHDGYIGDDGAVVVSGDNMYMDEFIPAVGFWIANLWGVRNITNEITRFARYDGDMQFLGRGYSQRQTLTLVEDCAYFKAGFQSASTITQQQDRIVGANILDTSICTIPNSTIDTNGDVQTEAGASISDFLPINEGIVICQLSDGADSALVVFYDENNALISRNAVTSALSNKRLFIQVPSNAKYVRFKCPNSPVATIYVSYVK